MTIYPEVVLFPHVRLSQDELTALPNLCGKAQMLVPDGLVAELPGYIKAVTPTAVLAADIRKAYEGLQKFGEQAMAEHASPKDYLAVGSAPEPLYDREAALGILAEFRTGATAAGDVAANDQNAAYRTVALTLLLSEDVASLQSQARNVLKGVEEQSAYMWDELKGGRDPLQLQTRDIDLDLVDSGFIKKRLTAWSILARINAVDAGVYVTFDKCSFEHCLMVFEPGAAIQKVIEKDLTAEFYQLPVDAQGFLNGLTRPEADLAPAVDTAVVLGYVRFNN